MSNLKLMARQSSHYFIAYALSMVAGLVTFPIYTRLFSLSEYGLLGLISTTVFFVMAVAKLGVQHAIIRFYDEARSGKTGVTEREYYSTLTYGPLAVVGLVSALYAVGVIVVHGRLQTPHAFVSFLLSAAVVFVMCANTIFKNFLRAEQNTGLFNILTVVAKYASLVCGVSLVYYVFRSIIGIYVSSLIVEGCVFVFIMRRLVRRNHISPACYRGAYFKESLAYGVPLVGMEFTSIVLNAGARYVILFYMSITAVGLYTAGYDLAMTATEALTFPLSFAIMPLYMKIYADKGTEETSIFLSNCLRYFLLAALPCVIGFNVLGREITVLLASDKFAEAYRVIPFVTWGLLLFGLGTLFNAGLFIAKKTHVLTGWTVAAAALNIGLNFLLVPRMGFVGSAVATLVSYLVLFLVLARRAFVVLPFRIDYRNIMKYLVFSAIMAGVMFAQNYGQVFISIAMKTLTGCIVYLSLVAVFDGEVREHIRRYVRKKGSFRAVA